MASHKKLSSLTIAATALFAAAIPCFAQAQANESRTDAVRPASIINVAESTLALNRETPAPKDVAPFATAEHQPRLLPAMFKQLDQFSTGRSFMRSTGSIFAPRVWNTTPQFRIGDELPPTPEVAFVPSRGQKLPDAAVLMH